jgi:hypothetical protein
MVLMSDPDGHWSIWATIAVVAVVVVAVAVIAVVAPEVIPEIVSAAADAYYSIGAAATVALSTIAPGAEEETPDAEELTQQRVSQLKERKPFPMCQNCQITIFDANVITH